MAQCHKSKRNDRSGVPQSRQLAERSGLPQCCQTTRSDFKTKIKSSPNKALAAEGFLLGLYRIALVDQVFPSVSASAWLPKPGYLSLEMPIATLVDQDFLSSSASAWVPKP